MTRALLLSTYVKFVNLFPEIKHNVEEIFLADSNLRSADAELQQRASEYLALAKITSLDVLATVLEEMPPFPEKVPCIFMSTFITHFYQESSGLLNLLKKKRPGRVPENPDRYLIVWHSFTMTCECDHPSSKYILPVLYLPVMGKGSLE